MAQAMRFSMFTDYNHAPDETAAWALKRQARRSDRHSSMLTVKQHQHLSISTKTCEYVLTELETISALFFHTSLGLGARRNK
jgi:hypothetical protein